MSNLKKQVNDKVEEIKSIVSDPIELAKIMDCVTDIVDAFSNEMLLLSKRQLRLEEKTEEIFDMLSNIEEELIQSLADDFTGECPYCGEDISYAIPEDGSDFECPKCHNIIELEMLFDDDFGCDCDDCHGGCHDDCDDKDEN